ncbi:peroxisomal succinyl-coenzyme A thioesterase-like [Melanotaenia boesemani]|uniref:peroxisomal succinyl-coenzyme A thioesterase-like n=1 Tax=Melanotaenia boesemani TaxID=1250792 RepID=UPI001C05A7A4|nr:peroxisomal succinyl-coenzyme A thioesterase-like [Melanotaenia boesemani]XP_041833105.1 peroxisomal succinyl-coenzyme A thioesterase-like [Melanotaenia boesemani]
MSQTAPPTVSVHPTRALVDEKFSVLVENLPPGFPVTIRSLHHSEDRDYWEAYGHYISNQNGTVSVTEDASLGGTYAGKEPMGLLWSMRPVPGSRPSLRLRKLDVRTPMLVSISVYSGHEDFRDPTPLASSLTERWYLAPGVQRIDISEKGVSGTLFIPPGPGPFPGILDLWGGGGGLLEYRSALLASHGYASLALEYIKTGETRSTNLELEHFEMAFDILKNHPQVMSDRVGIIGLSFGSLVALYMATESIHVKPLCIICISNIHIKPPGKYLSGFQEWLTQNIIARNEDNHQIWRNANLNLINEPSLKLNVGKMNCPVLLVNGCDDQNWPAVETAADIAKMMREAGKGNLLTQLDYPDTGHLIEPPFSPHFRATNFIIHSTKEKVVLLWGGKTKPHSDAQEDSWRKILSFLQQHLYCIPGHRAKL